MSDDSGAGRNVLAVPEFGVVRILRPFEGFEAVYEGQNAGHMIMLSEGSNSRDENADRKLDGYDPNLVRGLPVVMGSRVVIHLPSILENVLNGSPYLWKFMWRYRNVFDHRITKGTRGSYHLPKQGLGVADATGPNAGPRVVIPAAWQSVVYNQAEPILKTTHARQHVRAEDVFAGATRDHPPLMPDGSEGVIQQGVLPSTTPFYTQPLFVVYEAQAVADELLIGITRAVGTHPTWDFADFDLHIAEFFGSSSPDLGAYVTMGVSP